MADQNAAKVQELQKKIKMYSKASTFSSNKLKGEAQMELFKYTKDRSFLTEAVKSFTEAMEKNKKKDSIVLCQRAKAYNALGQTQLAVEDFRQAQTISSTQGGDILKNFQTQNMMKEIAKLDSVKSVIDKMRQNKELSPQFLNAFTDLTNVTQRCVVKLGVHQDRLNDHDDVLIKLTAQVEALQKQVAQKEDKANVKQMESKMQKYLDLYKNFQKNIGNDKDPSSVNLAIKQLQQRMQGLESNVKVVQTRIEQVQFKLDKFMHHNQQEFNKIKGQLKNMTNNIQAFGGKMKYFETEIDSVKQKVVYIDQNLKQSLYPKKQVKDQMEKWKKEDKQIYEYANNFYWLFNNYLLSYRMASTGMFEGKEPNPSFFQKHFKSIVDVVASALSIVPIVSEGVDIIKGIVQFLFDEYVARKFEMTIQKMNSLTKYINQEQMSFAIGKAVISICKMAYKIKEIRKVNNKSPLDQDDPITQARNWLNEKVDGMVSKASNVKVQEKTKIYQLALEDVTLFIGYILQVAELDKDDPIGVAVKQAFEGTQSSDNKINMSLMNLEKRKRKGLVVPTELVKDKEIGKLDKAEAEAGCGCFIY